MDDKKNVFTIKSKSEKITQLIDDMENKLIEVRYGHQESNDQDYDYNGGYSYSWMEYDTIGLFDNIDDAWKLVKYRVAKYHTQIKDYTFNIVIINPCPDTCPNTSTEDRILERYERDLEWDRKCKYFKKIEGFKCSECSVILKITNPSLEDNTKSNHARNHEKDGSWNHVEFKKIMKKGKKSNG